MKEDTPQEWYSTKWFLEELKAVWENPVTSSLTSQFNRYLAKIRLGEWEDKEKRVAESLLRIGFVGFMSGLRKKTINRQEFNRDELLLISRLLLVGVPEEAAIEIEKTDLKDLYRKIRGG